MESWGNAPARSRRRPRPVALGLEGVYNSGDDDVFVGHVAKEQEGAGTRMGARRGSSFSTLASASEESGVEGSPDDEGNSTREMRSPRLSKLQFPSRRLDPKEIRTKALSPGGMSTCSGETTTLTMTSSPMTPGSIGDDVSPMVVRYRRCSEQELPLSISIAQGGLQRIRREAQAGKVSLKKIVRIFGSAIMNMAKKNDAYIAKRGGSWTGQSRIAIFAGTSLPKITILDYLWRIVRALNAHADPAMFASDGSDLAKISSMTKIYSRTNLRGSRLDLDELGDHHQQILSPGPSSGDETGGEEAELKKFIQVVEDENSAMGRGLRCLLLSFLYIDRVCEKAPEVFVVNSMTAHRIILSAIYAATKFTDDKLPHIHLMFAQLGGVSRMELKRLEGAFCSLLDFELYVTEGEFQAHCMEQLRIAVRCARDLNEFEDELVSRRKKTISTASDSSSDEPKCMRKSISD